MLLRDYLLSGVVAILLAGGQVLFKVASVNMTEAGNGFVKALFSPSFLIAAGVYGAATLLWVYVLKTAPLSKAYPIAILGSALIPIASYFLFNEPISWKYAVGFFFILLGLILVSTG